MTYMEILEQDISVEKPEKNTIIGQLSGENSVISFKGEGNILCVEEDVRLTDSVITFCGDNSLIYLSRNPKHDYRLKIDAWRDTTIYFGENNYFNNTFSAIVSERQNLVVGGGGVFSFGIWLRTADPHLLYDCDSMKRINPSKSIFIGDHVWLGQGALILKGCRIGSGSVLAAGAVLAGKTMASNTVYAGNPAGKIKENVFFSGASVHNYTRDKTRASMSFKGRQFIYEQDETNLDLDTFEKSMEGKSPDERLEILKERLIASKPKNRFYQKGRESDRPGRKGFFSKFL